MGALKEEDCRRTHQVPPVLRAAPKASLPASDELSPDGSDRMHLHRHVILLTGARTEAAAALRLEHVHLEGLSDIRRSSPLSGVASVLAGGDTKTMSRANVALRTGGGARYSARSAGCRTRAAGDNGLRLSWLGTRLGTASRRRPCGFARSGWWWVSRSTALDLPRV